MKLASYGAGAARASALLNYQSHKGELSLEREDGSLVTGKAAVADLAAHWRDDNAREPSNDVFRLSVTFDGAISAAETREGLSRSLAGHRYAWRSEVDDDKTVVHLVAVAACSGKDDRGKRERIYANAKSLGALHDKIEDAFSRDAEFSEVKWAHGVEGATTMLAALTKAGKLEAEADTGRTLAAEAERLSSRRLFAREKGQPGNSNPALQLAKSWRPAMRSSSPRDFAHVILSAKPGTDKQAFMDAARATLAREFQGHEYVFVVHTNRQHIHVHAAIRLTSPTGEKLHPGIQDFARWRETLAKEARERRIPMEAVRRFDQAHAPGYKLKDVKMIERGIAPESVRRRVERVQNREVFRPTRDEGRKRAAEAAAHWKSLGARKAVALPPLAAGAVRLYRAEAVDATLRRAPLYSVDRAIAEAYAASLANARVVYLDMPRERLSELRPSREQPTKIFVVPRALSALSRPVGGIEDAAIIPFQARADAALAPRHVQPRSSTKEESPMRTAETMDAARRDMADRMSRIGDQLPDSAVKDDLMRRSRVLLDKADVAIGEQRRLERTPGEIEGERFVQPEPAQLGALFTNERKGAEIHYSRHDGATGAYETLAFVDRGKQLDVRDWNNPESVNAALKLASQKWETITLNGSDAYKETAARLAAEHGYNITNPEMQDRIRELRSKIEAQRATIAEGKIHARAPENAQRSDGAIAQPTHTDAGLAQRAAREASPEAVLNTTPAERAVELESIRERVDAEAKRETVQADRAISARETNAASGSEAVPFRSQEEARSARDAERAVDGSTSRPIPAGPNQSEEIQSLRHEHAKVLKQADRDAQRNTDLENVERLRAEERNRGRSESEGEER
ncbi:MAG: relaxase/mobilization nuclease domain-containing protein [Hyphomicrobiales bacterium]|nr:relaxase/mobilization nuclease domain-containing protein [Hyphomicrobiales bacterium]